MVALPIRRSLPAPRNGVPKSKSYPEHRPLPLPVLEHVTDHASEPVEAIAHDTSRRPRTRDECIGIDGPCPWVSCKYHLYLDVHPRTGSLKLNFPDIAPDELHLLPETCALDVAEEGGLHLEEVGAIVNLTRERVRQIEASGLLQIRRAVETGRHGRRRRRSLALAEDDR